MTGESGMLAVIPARGGSKGLAGKNIRSLAGLPLIAHSIRLAEMCPDITATVVSTDASEISEVAQQLGCDVPFLRPSALAADDTPLWPVLRHALTAVEERDQRRYEYLILLDPTSPTRLPEDVADAYRRLIAVDEADGIIGVSEPEFNPIWHSVVERDGWMSDLIPEGAMFDRRQDVPTVYRINGSLYIWRCSFLRNEEISWRRNGRHLMFEIPELRAVSIDTADEFQRTEVLIRSGLIRMPWLEDKPPD